MNDGRRIYTAPIFIFSVILNISLTSLYLFPFLLGFQTPKLSAIEAASVNTLYCTYFKRWKDRVLI
jgi:hypothetical protein